MLRNKTASKICSYWHSGQWSSFYQFSSSGVFVPENCLRYLQECEDNLHSHEMALHPYVISKKDEKELTQLKDFFIQKCESIGIEIEYKKHELYGYLIPTIKNNPQQIEIFGLKYLL